MSEIKLTAEQIKTAKFFLSKKEKGCRDYGCTECKLAIKGGGCLVFSEGRYDDITSVGYYDYFSHFVHKHEYDADDVPDETRPVICTKCGFNINKKDFEKQVNSVCPICGNKNCYDMNIPVTDTEKRRRVVEFIENNKGTSDDDNDTFLYIIAELSK